MLQMLTLIPDIDTHRIDILIRGRLPNSRSTSTPYITPQILGLEVYQSTDNRHPDRNFGLRRRLPNSQATYRRQIQRCNHRYERDALLQVQDRRRHQRPSYPVDTEEETLLQVLLCISGVTEFDRDLDHKLGPDELQLGLSGSELFADSKGDA